MSDAILTPADELNRQETPNQTLPLQPVPSDIELLKTENQRLTTEFEKMKAKLEAYEKVQGDAMTTIRTCWTCFVAVVGLIVGYNYFHTINIEKSTIEAIKKEVKDTVLQDGARQRNEEQERVIKSLNAALDAQAKLNEDKFLKITAGVQFQAGTLAGSTGDYINYAARITIATSWSLKAKDELNTQEGLKMLSKTCIPKLKKSDLDTTPTADLRFTVREHVLTLIKQLSEADQNDRYLFAISELKNALSEAETR